MASVYRARDTQLDRIVAVKVFPAGEASDDARREAEAQTLARLNHPNLVTLFDAHLAAPGAAEPSYIVMELVDGPSLRDELDRGRLPAEEVGVLAAELAEALVAVHAAGVVHRDLKPANILLALTGLPSQPYRGKLADFGIAHLVGSERITTDGVVIGTAAYLSPEQARGAEPGPPSDVYALGLILIEALSGERAFAGTPAEAIGARLVLDASIPAGLPSSWEQLLKDMTARDPEARPNAVAVAMSAREHAGELAGWNPPGMTDATPTVVLDTPVAVPFGASLLAPTVPMTAAGATAAPAAGATGVPTAFSAGVPAAGLPDDTESPEDVRRRRFLVSAASAVTALGVAGIIVVAAVAANAPSSQTGPDQGPSQTNAPIAPVNSNPPTPRPTPTTSPAPAPVVVPPSDNGTGTGTGNGTGNGTGTGTGDSPGKDKGDKGNGGGKNSNDEGD
jgi:hypothetical protein